MQRSKIQTFWSYRGWLTNFWNFTQNCVSTPQLLWLYIRLSQTLEKLVVDDFLVERMVSLLRNLCAGSNSRWVKVREVLGVTEWTDQQLGPNRLQLQINLQVKTSFHLTCTMRTFTKKETNSVKHCENSNNNGQIKLVCISKDMCRQSSDCRENYNVS